MRRLKRAHQRYVREQTKRRKKFRQRAIAAGTVAAITLGTGVSINKAIAAYTPDPHELAVSKDADADLLANREELAIGYRVFKADQNQNEIPDGVELAKRCAADINELPVYDQYGDEPEPNETYKINLLFRGLETCDICGTIVNMGGVVIVNPALNLTYPEPSPFGLLVYLPYISLHYMEHGSFSYAGDIHGADRLYDLQRMMRVLELRYPYEPNEHQLPLNYTGHTPTSQDPIKQLAPDANDLDGDLLADSEELEAGFNLYDPDQDNDLIPDGIELAKQCASAIWQLPEFEFNAPPGVEQIHKVRMLTDGQESCEICGFTICMDYWDIVNPRLGSTIHVPVIAAHYMEHGSLSYAATEHSGRVDVFHLLEVLEMPKQCGDLGTMYLPSDLNKDCKVNFADFAGFAERWLQSTDPNDSSDIEY